MKKNKILKICLSLILILALMLPGCSKKAYDAVEPAAKQKDAADNMASGKNDVVTDKTDSTTSGDDGAVSASGLADIITNFFGESSAASTTEAEGGAYLADTYGYSDALSGSLKEYSRSEAAKAAGGLAGTDYGTDGGFWTEGGSWSDKEAAADGGLISDDYDGWDDVDIDPVDPIDPEYPSPAAGLLTAGEWNDNLHFDFLKNLLNNGQQADYSGFFKAWELTPFSRLAIHVSTGETTIVSGSAIGIQNVNNAEVSVYSADGVLLWQSKTDNKGMTYSFYRLTGGDSIPATVKVSSGSFYAEKEVTSDDLLDSSTLEVYLESSYTAEKKLDLMFVIDTTGSMGDEIFYLQKELEDVISRVEKQNANLPIRLSVNFYRDLEDDYIVRSNPFSSNIGSQLVLLNAEYAEGGGDYEEAVELALEDAVNKHDWDEDSIKLMFMVLDAPPHNTDEVKMQLKSSLSDCVTKGIRIIPIASSGVDKSTEFLLRTFAMTTGGTYTFLTDHSGIGGSHIEPTIGEYEVENLNNMIVRIISEYLN
ncbi:MAG: VWA domain-containing protein [Lachnospiraceae bacterium]|nr:VWA domain-containing protein [Lachnospiraceae bacterium]